MITKIAMQYKPLRERVQTKNSMKDHFPFTERAENRNS